MDLATEQNIAKEQPGSTTALTHSSESCFKTCPRKYFLQYVQMLRPSHDSNALRIGSAFHLGLETAKSGGSEDESANAVYTAYLSQPCPPWLTLEEYDVEIETAAAMVRGWCRRWKDDQIVNYIAVEQCFDLPITNPTTGRETPNFRNRGKIDGICKLPDGRLAIIEHKTTSDDLDQNGDYWKRLLMDSQISRYLMAARQLGFDVQTTVYDVTRKCLIRPKAISKLDRARATADRHYFGFPIKGICPEQESAKLFAARLLNDMASRPDWYFARAEVPRLESDLAEFQAEEWTVKSQIRECELNQKRWGAAAWPRNTGACTSPYRCVYLDVCRGLCGDPTEQVPAGFKRVREPHTELTPA